MAEAAAVGGLVAYEVAETAVQVGAAGYMVAKPSNGLKAQFNQIATSRDDETKLSLVRSNHTVTVIKKKAYIFGGETGEEGHLAGNEIHAVTLDHSGEKRPEPEYSVLPAIPIVEGEVVPAARTKHAACRWKECVAVFGGVGEDGKNIDEEAVIWTYNTETSKWTSLRSNDSGIAPVQRSGARLFSSDDDLILYGGIGSAGQPLKDVWYFASTSVTWTPLSSAPVSTSNAALSESTLYLIDGEDSMSSSVHMLHIGASTSETISKPSDWTKVTFPTNPLTPGPRPRVRGGLVPITTGYGRNYLLYFFGARQDSQTGEAASTDGENVEDPTQWSDAWTLQLPSTSPTQVSAPTSLTSLTTAFKPAKIKDAIRSTLGYDSGEQKWEEVEVLPPGDLVVGEGKVHPGPRAEFGFDALDNLAGDGKGSGVFVWGGTNAGGIREGDGWVVNFS